MAWDDHGWRDSGWRDKGDDATGSGWDTSGGWNTSGGWDTSDGKDTSQHVAFRPDPAEEADRRYQNKAYKRTETGSLTVKGNGYRPKANDPDGWNHGENKPTELEYTEMMECGRNGFRKKIKPMFETYAHRESETWVWRIG